MRVTTEAVGEGPVHAAETDASPSVRDRLRPVRYTEAMVTINVSLDDKLAEELDALAKRMGRPLDDLTGDLFRRYLESMRRFVGDVNAGIADADASRVHTIDEVRAELDRRRAARAR